MIEESQIDERMNRQQVCVGNAETLARQDREYWAKASAGEKFAAITRLREYFYGEEATTGRLQRICRVFKRE